MTRLMRILLLSLLGMLLVNNSSSPSRLFQGDGSFVIDKFVSNIDAKAAQRFFASNRNLYGNKSDFAGLKRMFAFVKSLGLDRKESVVLVGGTNDGQSCWRILDQCPFLTLFGFEIQKKHYRQARKNLNRFRHATVLNLGWSDHVSYNASIGGEDEVAGLFDPSQRGWKQQTDTVQTVPLAQWTDNEQSIINPVMLYVLIDTEGHEPKVIRGMELHEVRNQRKFPLFQYELGGTWAQHDNRHGHDPWTQRDTAMHLEKCGYLLFLIGVDDWLAVTADFFVENNNPGMEDEGYGPFIQGNLLAVHHQFTPPQLLAKILDNVRVSRRIPAFKNWSM